MAVDREWVFECDAPRDEFTRALRRSLILAGVAVDDASHYDFAASAWGARAFVRVEHEARGLKTVARVKGGFFAGTSALEEAILEAGRRAASDLTFGAAR
ncbi:MAG: hypothetical protein ACYDCK_03570 [Thermoplasmatota archaeon]